MPATTDHTYGSGSLNENKRHHLPRRSVDPYARSADRPQQSALLIGPSDFLTLGDQLRPHVVSRLFDFDAFRCAGLVSKDLTRIGGHRVLNFGEAALELEGTAPTLIHLGGDHLLSGLVSGYHRAVEGRERGLFVSLVQVAAREEMLGYVRRRTGQNSCLGYVMANQGCFSGSDSVFLGTRIPEPTVLEDDEQSHFLDCTRQSSFVGVSGEGGFSFLERHGVECREMPCVLSALPRVCSRLLKRNEEGANLKAIRNRFGKGWIMVEVSNVPERHEKNFAEMVSSFSALRGWGIVAYSTKISDNLQRSMQSKWEALLGQFGNAVWLESENIWEITNCLAGASCYLGSCLDSRILAGAFGIPRINLPVTGSRIADYCKIWDPGMDATLGTDADEWGNELNRAVLVDPSELQAMIARTGDAFFSGLNQISEKTRLTRRVFARDANGHLQAVVRGKQIAGDWFASRRNRERFERLNPGRKDSGKTVESEGLSPSPKNSSSSTSGRA